MKKTCITFLLLAIITLTGIGIILPEIQLQPNFTNTEYLRIHIRADSNEQQAQAVKYKVKESVVGFLTPKVSEIHTKEQAKQMLIQNKEGIKSVVDKTLKQNGFSYTSTVKIESQEFPLRAYGDLVLEAGIYDAVIIELGSGQGDNWWCVVYPPLCFTDSQSAGYTYKSKIAKIIQDFRQRLKGEK